MWNETIPGQNGNSSVYPGQLAAIADVLDAFAVGVGARVVGVLTTAFLCNVTSDGNIVALNNVARGIYEAHGWPVVDMHTPIVDQCGAPPVQSCFNSTGCFCPHCPPGYSWLANATLVPALRALLGA